MVTNQAMPDGPWDVEDFKAHNLYFHLVEVTKVAAGSARVHVKDHGEMLMFGSYSYLWLIAHPAINAAAQEAITTFATGTNGVRLLPGTVPLHNELEASIARATVTSSHTIEDIDFGVDVMTAGARELGIL